jgi:hypothetical protein
MKGLTLLTFLSAILDLAFSGSSAYDPCCKLE